MIFNCDDCSFETDIKSRLKNHTKRVHQKLKDVECDFKLDDGSICAYKCYSNSELKTHTKNVHYKIKDYNCTELDDNGKICTIAFCTKASLEIHIQNVHIKAKNFVCDRNTNEDEDSKCSFKCATKETLRVHILSIHEKLYNFECEELNKNGSKCTFSSCREIQLRNHIARVHHQIKNENCLLCNYMCFSKGDLRMHVKNVHNRIKDVSCDVIVDGIQCEFRSSVTSKLNIHKATVHDKLKRFSCSQCDYECFEQVKLLSHIERIHKGLREISCLHEKCEMKFFNNSSMKSHWLRLHVTDVYNFPCLDTGCGKLYHFRYQLNNHIQKHHQGNITKYVKREEERLRDVFKFYELNVVYNRTIKLLTIPGESKQYAQMDFEWHERGDVLFLIEVDESSQHNQRAILPDTEYEHKHKKIHLDTEEEAIDSRDDEIYSDEENFVDSDDDIDEDSSAEEVSPILHGKRKLNQLGYHEFDCENQAYNVSCEQDRMTAIQSWFVGQGETRPIVFIRYNPLNFRVDGKLRKVSRDDREEQLIHFMKTFEIQNNQPLTLQYMYYDSYTLIDVTGAENLVCKVWQHKDYDPNLRQFCLEPIVG